MCLLSLGASQPPPDGVWAPLLPGLHSVSEVSGQGVQLGLSQAGTSRRCPGIRMSSVATQL